MRHQIKQLMKNIVYELPGSMTVEASFIFPMIILLMAYILSLFIQQSHVVEEAAQDITRVCELDSMKVFYLVKTFSTVTQ